jgi:hypothetical protein
MVQASAKIKGSVSWTSVLPSPQKQSVDLLLWRDHLVVVTPDGFSLHDVAGKMLWQRPRRFDAALAIANEAIYTESRANFLQAVTLDNEFRLADAPLPGISGSETFLRMLWPRTDDFIVASTLPDPKYDAEELGEGAVPELYGLRVRYGSRFGEWNGTYKGTLNLAPLFSPESATWLAFTHEVVAVNVDTEAEKKFPIGMDTPIEWSVDALGNLAVIGQDHGKNVALALDRNGRELWRYDQNDATEAWANTQPPIGSAAARLFVLTSRRVLALDAGRLAWIFDAGSESLRHGASTSDGTFEVQDGKLISKVQLRHASGLGDGTLLVVANNTMWHVDANGQRLSTTVLPEAIVCPPVVDSAGHVYVASLNAIYKIE